MRSLFWVAFAIVLICLCVSRSRADEPELSIQQWMRQYEAENNLPPAVLPENFFGEEEVIAVYENLKISDDVPDYAAKMTPEQYKVWAEMQNEMAYYEAARRASEQSFGRTVYSTTLQTFRNFGYWWGRGSSVTAATSETWTPTQWGGGPVLIINPYCPPKQ